MTNTMTSCDVTWDHMTNTMTSCDDHMSIPCGGGEPGGHCAGGHGHGSGIGGHEAPVGLLSKIKTGETASTCGSLKNGVWYWGVPADNRGTSTDSSRILFIRFVKITIDTCVHTYTCMYTCECFVCNRKVQFLGVGPATDLPVRSGGISLFLVS